MSFYPVNGVVLGVLQRGTVAPVLVRGVQDPEADPAGLVVEITLVVLHHLPLPTQRMDLRRPDLKDKAEVRAFGQVWQQVASARISITGPRNPVRSLNRRLGIGKGLGWRDRRDILVSLNRNRRLHLDGDRPRGPMIIEVKVPQISVQ